MPLTLMLSIFLAQTAQAAQSARDEALSFSSAEMGVSIRLPSTAWKESDHGQGIARVLVFSPKPDLSVRCSLLYLPATMSPEGLLTREAQIRLGLGAKYKRVSYEPVELAGRTFDRLTYAVAGTTTVEYGARIGEFFFIFQLAAPDDRWKDADGRAELDGIRDSLRLFDAAQTKPPGVDRSTSEQVRAKRAAAKTKKDQPYEIVRHQVEVEINPREHTLRARDKLRVRSKKDGVAAITLYTTLVDVVSVESDTSISWKTPSGGPNDGSTPRVLEIEFAEPLTAGKEITIEIETASNDFLVSIDQKLVQEIAIVGQVREDSSFSSHVVYYPIDEVNDAAVDVSLTVPNGYVAVTGGEPVGRETANGHTTFRYHAGLRTPRALPFGFAVGRFVERAGQSRGGLNLTVYGYAGEEKVIQQHVDVAVQAANVFERMMGPLPWNHVRYAHVKPERKETGVSLPGLILLSDGFFGDLTDVDLSDGNLARRDALDLLVVADELSHQWNFYSVALPNEFSEGISTFTNLLFVEDRHGPAAYRNGMKYCRDAYFTAIKLDREVAIADPDIYYTQAYRGIAFCKVPIVLDMLRSELGDDTFFRAWRKVFAELRGKSADYDDVERVFSKVAGRDLEYFFNQWFFRAGVPKITVSFVQSKDNLTVRMRQTHEGEPYRMSAEIVVRGPAGQTRRRAVDLRETETVVRLDCDFQVEKVVFDPDEKLLREVDYRPVGQADSD